MPRTNISLQAVPGPYPTLPISANSLDCTETQADVANGNQATIVNGKTFILAHNTTNFAYTVTMTSIADERGRTGDITAYSLGAGEICMFGPFKLPGWDSGSSKLYFSATNPFVKFIMLDLTIS